MGVGLTLVLEAWCAILAVVGRSRRLPISLVEMILVGLITASNDLYTCMID